MNVPNLPCSDMVDGLDLSFGICMNKNILQHCTWMVECWVSTLKLSFPLDLDIQVLSIIKASHHLLLLYFLVLRVIHSLSILH
jgi:hypothetical protein